MANHDRNTRPQIKADSHTVAESYGSGGGIGGSKRIEESVMVIEINMQHLATKEDVQIVRNEISNTKIWFLASFIGAIPATIGVIFVLQMIFAAQS